MTLNSWMMKCILLSFFSPQKVLINLKKNFLYLCLLYLYISKYGSSTSYLFLTLNNILAFIHSFIQYLLCINQAIGAYDLTRETDIHWEQVLICAWLTYMDFTIPIDSYFCSQVTEEVTDDVGSEQILESQPSGNIDHYMHW